MAQRSHSLWLCHLSVRPLRLPFSWCFCVSPSVSCGDTCPCVRAGRHPEQVQELPLPKIQHAALTEGPCCASPRAPCVCFSVQWLPGRVLPLGQDHSGGGPRGRQGEDPIQVPQQP